eukprot:13244186-Ditylum_brightwellii.AAC.1
MFNTPGGIIWFDSDCATAAKTSALGHLGLRLCTLGVQDLCAFGVFLRKERCKSFKGRMFTFERKSREM